MYAPLLILHSILRWAVLVFGILAAIEAFTGWRGGRPWGSTAEGRAKRFVMTFDVQFVVGLLLYGVFSPLTTAAFQDFGGAMRDPALRFFAVEHITLMLVALALAHVGKVKATKARDHAAKHRTAAIYFGLAVLLIVLATPWPFQLMTSQLRPLLRLAL